MSRLRHPYMWLAPCTRSRSRAWSARRPGSRSGIRVMRTASLRSRCRTRQVTTPAGITCGAARPGTLWTWGDEIYGSGSRMRHHPRADYVRPLHGEHRDTCPGGRPHAVERHTALALVALSGHAQPSAGDLCGPVGGYSEPLSDLEAASRSRPTADWESVGGLGTRSPTAGLCRMIYLEAFSCYAGIPCNAHQATVRANLHFFLTENAGRRILCKSICCILSNQHCRQVSKSAI
jgi:hypothetical protein